MFLSTLPILLISCTAPVQESRGTFEDFQVPSPLWSNEELQENIERGLSLGLPHALTLRNQYARLLSFRDGDCPPMLQEGTIIGTWEGTCSSNYSYDFHGTGIFFEIENSAPDLPYEMALQSSLEITDPDGAMFISGGISTYAEIRREGEEFFEQNIGGSYRHDLHDGWLKEGVDASLSVSIGTRDGSIWADLNGGIGYRDLKIYFEELQVDLGYCDMPYGAFQVRDPSGYWFSLKFTDCSGCAKGYWQDKSIGEICVGTPLIEATLALLEVERQ